VKNLLVFLLIGTVILSGCTSEKTEPMNPFLTEYSTPFGVPPFDLIKNEHFIPATKAGFSEQLAEIESIVENAEAPTFENTIVA